MFPPRLPVFPAPPRYNATAGRIAGRRGFARTRFRRATELVLAIGVDPRRNRFDATLGDMGSRLDIGGIESLRSYDEY